MKILFQGDSITDADRDREDPHNLGNGYPKDAARFLKEKYRLPLCSAQNCSAEKVLHEPGCPDTNTAFSSAEIFCKVLTKSEKYISSPVIS